MGAVLDALAVPGVDLDEQRRGAVVGEVLGERDPDSPGAAVPPQLGVQAGCGDQLVEFSGGGLNCCNVSDRMLPGFPLFRRRR